MKLHDRASGVGRYRTEPSLFIHPQLKSLANKMKSTNNVQFCAKMRPIKGMTRENLRQSSQYLILLQKCWYLQMLQFLSDTDFEIKMHLIAFSFMAVWGPPQHPSIRASREYVLWRVTNYVGVTYLCRHAGQFLQWSLLKFPRTIAMQTGRPNSVEASLKSRYTVSFEHILTPDMNEKHCIVSWTHYWLQGGIRRYTGYFLDMTPAAFR